jgi:hypothetical protein
MIMQSTWKGSADTLEVVKEQIAERWGEEAANAYNPKINCFTFKQWQVNGFMVKRGEKALKSYTFVEVKDKKTEEIKKLRKTVCLFYRTQVEPMKTAGERK